MSYKPQVLVQGTWSSNALVFATKDEAEQYAKDLFNRWTLCEDSRAIESSDEVNYAIVNNTLTEIGA